MLPERFTRGSLRILRALALGAGLLMPCLAAATPSEVAQGEIDHLLDFVGTSKCAFVRNGTVYPAPEARSHLEMKYRFAKGRLSSAEEFIQYLATGSSVSGDAYHVRCGSQDALAGVWLATELRRYRQVGAHAVR